MILDASIAVMACLIGWFSGRRSKQPDVYDLGFREGVIAERLSQAAPHFATDAGMDLYVEKARRIQEWQ